MGPENPAPGVIRALLRGAFRPRRRCSVQKWPSLGASPPKHIGCGMWIGGRAGKRMGGEGTEWLGSSSRLPPSVPRSAEAIIPAASGGAGAGSHPKETWPPRAHAFDGAAAPSPAPGGYN